MTASRASRVPGGKPPRDLRVRRFHGDDGRAYAALWFSRRRGGTANLTEAEREVAEMIRAGFSNAAIAKARRVAKATVATQVRSVLAKLGAASRGELVARSTACFGR